MSLFGASSGNWPSPGSAQHQIEILPDTEAGVIRTALTPTSWTLRGRRNRGFVLVSGEGQLEFESSELPFVSPCAVWLPAGKTARLTLKSGSRGALVSVSELAFGRAVPAGLVGRQVKDALLHPLIGARLQKPQALELMSAIEAVERELRSELPGGQEAARHHLVLALMTLWRISSPQPQQVQAAPRTIVRNFLHLLELHLRDHWTIAAYAGALKVSRTRLTSAVKRITGRAPLELIHERLVIEAEALLAESNLQVAEIADALGFKDAGYFNRFYKRETGIPPGRTRKRGAERKKSFPGFHEWP
ncbi:AraC family transcriptional regulator [Labrenzia sp. OB1]|uniref:helix-turn-helix domain-containing protein n=1 Tax=Labrenzia sp. OB1 TaxID=1561204 RepID=UPI000838141E|nr:AraC family transcriptional regulator [Labrenzia sp. OB1]